MDRTETPLGALEAAVSLAGGQSAFGRICGVGQPAVWKWLQSSKRLPAEHVLKVEAATGISRHALRPDIYPVEHAEIPIGDGSEPELEFGPVLSQLNNRRQSNRADHLDGSVAA